METMSKPRSLVTSAALPLAIYLCLYEWSVSHVPSTTADSIYYINTIDSGTRLLHPHHLLYNSLASMWVAVCRVLGFHTDSGILVSRFDAFFGALALCVFYSLIRRRLGSDPMTALLATGLPAFSWGFWYYSECVEVYIIPLFLQLMCLYLLTDEQVDGRTFALVGFLNGLAVLVAEMSILFSLVVFVAAWLRYRHDQRNLVKSLANYLLAAVPTATG